MQRTGRFLRSSSHTTSQPTASDEAKKRSILLSACGTSTYKLVRTLVAPDAVTDKTFEEIAELAQHHYHPKPSVIMRRFRFNTCVRHPGEKVTTFIARLHDLASHCDYGGATAELVRDRLVCDIRDDALQHSLLSVAKLTFDKACELALLHKSAEENSKVLSTPTAVHRTERQAPATAEPRRSDSDTQDRPEIPCYRCGGQYTANNCRFKESLCNFCGKKGHIQRVCRSHRREMQHPPFSRQGSQSRQTHHLEEDVPAEPPLSVDYNLFAVSVDRVAPITAEVLVNGSNLRMEIDTGAAVSLISEATYFQLWEGNSGPKLEPSALKLRTYSGQELKLVGEVVVKVTYGQQEEDLSLQVVKGNGPSLLGRDWLARIKLDWSAIRTLRRQDATLDEVLDAHKDLFAPELGTIKGTTAKLHIDSTAKPRFCRPRGIPHALRSRWKKH